MAQGKKETFVAIEFVRMIGNVSHGGVITLQLEEGDKVECLYKGKGTKWFSGKITRVNRDGTCDIKYDDGDIEVGANKANIRPHPDAPKKSNVPIDIPILREGMKVEARYRGRSKYYPGVIRKTNRDGSFDIDYNDVRIIVPLISGQGMES